VELRVENKAQLAQVLALTESASLLSKRAAQARAAAATTRSQLEVARARVAVAEIPQECPAAVQWLFDEVSK